MSYIFCTFLSSSNILHVCFQWALFFPPQATEIEPLLGVPWSWYDSALTCPRRQVCPVQRLFSVKIILRLQLLTNLEIGSWPRYLRPHFTHSTDLVGGHLPPDWRSCALCLWFFLRAVLCCFLKAWLTCKALRWLFKGPGGPKRCGWSRSTFTRYWEMCPSCCFPRPLADSSLALMVGSCICFHLGVSRAWCCFLHGLYPLPQPFTLPILWSFYPLSYAVLPSVDYEKFSHTSAALFKWRSGKIIEFLRQVSQYWSHWPMEYMLLLFIFCY